MPGVYRGQQVIPKAGDSFSGKGSVTLNGSTVLSFAASSTKNVWVASAVANTKRTGVCLTTSPLCNYVQDSVYR